MRRKQLQGKYPRAYPWLSLSGHCPCCFLEQWETTEHRVVPCLLLKCIDFSIIYYDSLFELYTAWCKAIPPAYACCCLVLIWLYPHSTIKASLWRVSHLRTALIDPWASSPAAVLPWHCKLFYMLIHSVTSRCAAVDELLPPSFTNPRGMEHAISCLFV